MDLPGRAPISTCLDQLRADTRRIADLIDIGPLDAPVPTCPGWDLAALVGHLGGVHRWALHAAREGTRPDRRPGGEGPDGARLGAWLVQGAEELAEVLERTRPDAPSWNPFGAEPVAAFWPRRQAHETMVHRFDAELALGLPTPLPAEMASDGIDELFEVLVPARLARPDAPVPLGSLHVHCTDVPGEWLVRLTDDGLEMRREHAKGDAALRGPAAALLLHLWGRRQGLPVEFGTVEVIGEPAVAAGWSDLMRS